MDEKLSFEPIASLARPMIDNVVYASLTTVSATGTPRSRIVHPVWDWTSRVTGWITVRPTSLVLRHLATNDRVTCTYWSPAHDAVYLDGTARPARADELDGVWSSIAAITGPTAFDPFTIFPEGPVAGIFNAVIVTPDRIRVVEAARLATGGPNRVWVKTESDALALQH